MKFPNFIKVFGDVDFRGDCPKESAEQMTFFNWVRKTPYGAIAIHIRNEGKRNYMETARQKVEGMCVGASDIIIPGGVTFVCELKRQDHTKSKWQKGQLEFLKAAHDNGAFVCVALGHKAAQQAFKEWRKQND